MQIRILLPCLLCLTVELMLGSAGHFWHTSCSLSQRSALCSGSQLASIPADLPNSIEDLHLDNNDIKLLKNTCLVSYPELRILNIASNGLDTVESNAFRRTRHVEKLSLAENCLYASYQELGEALSDLSHLRVLDLSGNGLTEDMVSFLLQNMTSLEFLSLSGNTILRLDQSIFRDLHQLRELNLERNHLFDIEEGAFDSLQRLQWLNLAFNSLPCLVGFQLTQVVMLNASHNSIEWFISNQDLNDTFHLETLDLRDNKLLFFPFLPTRSRLQNLLLSDNQIGFYEHLENSSLPNWVRSVQFFNLNSNVTNVTVNLWDETLHGDISSLDILDLTSNQVTYLPQGFLSEMTHLSRLKLGSNCLKSFSFDSDELSANLYEIDVSNNQLTVLQANQSYLHNLENLRHVNLSHNDLQRLPPMLFLHLPVLTVVDLSQNKVAICSLEEQDAEAEYSDCVVWRSISSLRQLYLRDCGLGWVPAGAFDGTPLMVLELSGNRGVVIGQESMTGITQTLQHLGLGSTNLHNLDFTQFVKLYSLNISGNSISYLPDSILSLSLRRLDLRENHLQAIHLHQAQVLSRSLESLFLGGNPLNCCQVAWFKVLRDIKTLTIEDLSSLTCLSDFGGRSLDTITSDYCGRSEEEPSWLYVLLFLPVFLSLVGIGVIFFLTFRPNLLPSEIKRRCWKPTPY
ncbi:transforming growth factor beta activator LRRC33-like [Paramormyrops kingsleyae]|uniref:Negative regulator of reactive oxygen species n=1 Tax=Paramormyrops kingsleyae TaxID=1676925 RepID=A0A3B3R5X1_9TELE|nr:negative regulator of reactive oxygen species-like [Paramormyrops kingsleyae]